MLLWLGLWSNLTRVQPPGRLGLMMYPRRLPLHSIERKRDGVVDCLAWLGRDTPSARICQVHEIVRTNDA